MHTVEQKNLETLSFGVDLITKKKMFHVKLSARYLFGSRPRTYGQKGTCKETVGKISIRPSEEGGVDVFMLKNLILVIIISGV